LSGLKILLALVNNWDNKPENAAIDRVTAQDDTVEDHYLFTDWGAGLGRMAGPPAWNPALTRWNAEHFKADRFVSGWSNGSVTLNFKGQVPLGPIPIEHVKWFAELAGQLRSEQVRVAFETASASPQQAEAFARRVIEKIAELGSVVATMRWFRRSWRTGCTINRVPAHAVAAYSHHWSPS
jgi:hypothetical protein